MDINEALNNDNMHVFKLRAPYGLTFHEKGVPIKREAPKVGRNDLCPCGSGRKFKACCLGKKADQTP